MAVPTDPERRVALVKKRLRKAIVEPACELRHDSAWQLLIATILSAQSTDRTVNRVTPALFERFPTPAALAEAELSEVEDLVRPTGFFRNKAKAIIRTSAQLEKEHGGVVPKKLEELIKLHGVARKTANVVLGTAYRVSSGVTVDTHAGRVSRRLGLTEHTDPVKVERDLCAIFAKRDWIDMGHRLVLHGRYVCKSSKPRCAACPLAELCPAREAAPVGRWGQRATAENKMVSDAISESLG